MGVLSSLSELLQERRATENTEGARSHTRGAGYGPRTKSLCARATRGGSRVSGQVHNGKHSSSGASNHKTEKKKSGARPLPPPPPRIAKEAADIFLRYVSELANPRRSSTREGPPIVREQDQH